MPSIVEEAVAFIDTNPTDLDCLEGERLHSLLGQYDNFFFDCDGVLWRGNELLPDVALTLDLLRSNGKRVFFVTNNSSKSRAQYLQKFSKLGITVSLEEIIPSSWAAAEYLSTLHPEVKKAFVVGSQGLVDELGLVGIESIGGPDPAYASRAFATEGEFSSIKEDPDIGAVVCGWDLSFNFVKLCAASLHLQKNPQIVFLATNKDAFDRMNDRNVPGNGCAVAAIECSVGREAITVGKPSKWLMDRILGKFNLQASRTVVIGDRLDTDIMLGVNGGTASILVGTGCTGMRDLMELKRSDPTAPTYLLSHVGAIYQSHASNGCRSR